MNINTCIKLMINYDRAWSNLLKSLLGFIWFDQILEDWFQHLKLTSLGLCRIDDKDHFKFPFIIECRFSSRSLKKLFFFPFIDIVECCFCENVFVVVFFKHRKKMMGVKSCLSVNADDGWIWFQNALLLKEKTMLYNSVWEYFTRS